MVTSLMLIGVPVFLTAYGVYKRTVPVHGVAHEALGQVDSEVYTLLDVRAYNVSYKEPLPEAFNLPISYFTRGYKEIPNKPIHLFAENQSEKNLAIRLLHQKGFQVASYSLMGENNEDKMHTACC
ncbi:MULTISPECIES: rhodanese-like domain-containing protein [Planococcus]|uniref:Sulfurtransferase n=1 Tax=Planococcus wigleyi TaxID=2762216 RepID=A0ABR8WCN8_9BACL|nr:MULTISPECIES: hypothetical protein [Planococcus]MBD8014800.1 hypothetical protein [Planococcus wigleyi]MDN3437041.1 hypothetical protein [Planococcus sp. APC 3900]